MHTHTHPPTHKHTAHRCIFLTQNMPKMSMKYKVMMYVCTYMKHTHVMHTGGQPLTFQPFPVLGRRKYVRPYGTAGPGQAGVVGLCSFNLQQLVVQEKQHCQLCTNILPTLLSSLICHQHCHCHRTLYRNLPLTEIAILDTLTQWNTSATSHVLYT